VNIFQLHLILPFLVSAFERKIYIKRIVIDFESPFTIQFMHRRHNQKQFGGLICDAAVVMYRKEK